MSTDKTSLGDRMKGNYEDRYRYYLPRRTHAIIRLDGKAFHSYTRGFDKPADVRLTLAMVSAGMGVMKEIQGSAFGYHQSDELSILITDFATIHTEAPFDYNIQKLASVSASVMTGIFNDAIHLLAGADELDGKLAFFDARVFAIPDREEVYNYFVWRQRDCIRNSIQALGQAHFSQKQLHGLSMKQVQEKLFTEKGINWSEQPAFSKNGTLFSPGNVEYMEDTFTQTSRHHMIPTRLD